MEKEYWVVGLLPVILKWENKILVEVLKYDWETGIFINGWEYYAEISMSSRGDMDEYTEKQFVQHVETLRSKLTFPGELEEIYAATRSMTNTAKEASRPFTWEEKERFVTLQYASYRLFEATIGGGVGAID